MKGQPNSPPRIGEIVASWHKRASDWLDREGFSIRFSVVSLAQSSRIRISDMLSMCRSINYPTKGFALVIALGLMSFVVFLLLGITTFFRVESSTAAQSLRLLEARQNALLGGMMAVGELQKQLGPDRRATANAETVSASSPNSLWLGAFQTMDSANPTATREQVRSASLANVEWLVSRPGDASQPADFAFDHSGDSDNFIRMGALTRADNTTIEAFAGKTRISPALTSSGSFAWWVSDESQKARVNEVNEESEFLSATSQTLADFSTAQKTDLRALDSATVADPDFAPGPLQARISRFADLELLPFSPADRREFFYHGGTEKTRA